MRLTKIKLPRNGSYGWSSNPKGPYISKRTGKPVTDDEMNALPPKRFTPGPREPSNFISKNTGKMDQPKGDWNPFSGVKNDIAKFFKIPKSVEDIGEDLGLDE